MNATSLWIFIGLIVYGIVDFYFVKTSGVSSSISQEIVSYVQASPVGAFVFGCVVGHLFFTMKPDYSDLKAGWLKQNSAVVAPELEAAILVLIK